MTQPQPANTFGDWGQLAIAKHFEKFLKHEAEVLKDKDPEQLHQMRVGMRRLRSAMIGFAPALNLPPTATEKKVGKVARVLGTLRDLDVLELTLAQEYEPNLPSKEQKHLAKANQVLKKERKKAFKQVKSTLESKLYQGLKQGLQDWLDKPSYTAIAMIKIEQVLPDLLLPEVCRLLIHPGWLVGVELEAGEVKFNDEITPEIVEQNLAQGGEILHDLRKEAKRNRYNLALFTQFYGEAYQNYLTQIKAIQSILGEIQDSFVLREFLEQVFESDLEKYLPTLAMQLKQARYQKWQEWQRLQRYFLDLSTRQDLQKTLINS